VAAVRRESVLAVKEFLYTGACTLDGNNVVEILRLAEALQFAELADAARAALSASLTVPSTALALLDDLLHLQGDAASPSSSSRELAVSVLSYVQRNAAEVLRFVDATLRARQISLATVDALLRQQWIYASEAALLRFLVRWVETDAARSAPAAALAALFALIDFCVVPPATLIAAATGPAGQYMAQDRYVAALEHHAAPVLHPRTVKYRDHGRLAVGHAAASYEGYRLVGDLAEFIALLPELALQHDLEGGGVPILARFHAKRFALGLRDGLPAVGWDPALISVRSATVDFNKIGEHSGPFATLAINGQKPSQWPSHVTAWALNPPILVATITTPEDKLDRPGLFVRTETGPFVVTPPPPPPPASPPEAKLVDDI
jgi:hypothetical protein